jgi:hypothetical protein
MSDNPTDAEATVISDGAYTVFVADFADTDSAWEAYELLKSLEDGRNLKIEGVLVVAKDADGKVEVQKVTDHSTRSGLTWGLVGGIALGVLFPPSMRPSSPGTRASSRSCPIRRWSRSARRSRRRTGSWRRPWTRPSPRTSRLRPASPPTAPGPERSSRRLEHGDPDRGLPCPIRSGVT